MADTIAVKDFSGSSATVLTDEVTGSSFGAGHVQVFKQMDGTAGSTNMQVVDSVGSAFVRQQDLLNDGTIDAAAEAVTLAVNGASAAGIQLSGTYVGTLQFEGTINGSDWVSLYSTANGTSGAVTSVTSVSGVWQTRIGGFASIRVRCSAYTSGSVYVVLRATQSSGNVNVDTPLPAGTNNIGKVTNVGTAATSNPSAVANAAASNLMTDKLGRLVTVNSHVRDLSDSAVLTLNATTTSTSLIAAAASTFHDIVGMTITNSAATGTWVEILDVTTVKYRVWVPGGGGGPIPLVMPLKQASVNTAWNARTETSTNQVTVNVQYVKNI